MVFSGSVVVISGNVVVRLGIVAVSTDIVVVIARSELYFDGILMCNSH